MRTHQAVMSLQLAITALAGRAVKLLHQHHFTRSCFVGSYWETMQLSWRNLQPRGLGPFGGPCLLASRYPHSTATQGPSLGK